MSTEDFTQSYFLMLLPIRTISGRARASMVAQMVKNLCSAGKPSSILGLGRSPGEGNGNPLQYSCLENSMDRGAWWTTVQGVAKSVAGYSSWGPKKLDTTERLTLSLFTSPVTNECQCLLLSHIQHSNPMNCNPMTEVAHQAPLSMEFSRQEYWSG